MVAPETCVNCDDLLVGVNTAFFYCGCYKDRTNYPETLDVNEDTMDPLPCVECKENGGPPRE